MENINNKIIVDNTKFIFTTNLAGDASRDRFGNSTPNANIIIPDDLAAMMLEDGFNVKQTKPNDDYEGEYIPQYFVRCVANYNSPMPPRIYLISGDNPPRLLGPDEMSLVDRASIKRIDVTLNPYVRDSVNAKSLYIDVMYVTQNLDDDPFFARYHNV